MLINMLFWWYAKGWGIFAKSIFSKERRLADFFSISLLVKTLFEPFRQISAGGTSSEALDARFQAFIDKSVSRFIGFFIRFFIILFGIISMAALLVVSIVLVLCWPFVPFAPVAGVVLCTMGVTL